MLPLRPTVRPNGLRRSAAGPLGSSGWCRWFPLSRNWRWQGAQRLLLIAAVGIVISNVMSSGVAAQLNLFGRRGETTPAATVPANVKRVGTQLTGFGIPFSIDDPDDKFVEVQLYTSKNRGLTWQFYARQNLAAREIPFRASGDGEYWFCLKTLDRNRQLQPPGNATVELIVVVDTLRPEVDFRVQSDAAGRVVCRWKADDQNIDPSTVQLAYRPLLSANDAENVWVEVPYRAVETAKNGTFSDQYAFWAEASARELVVRLKIADLGGNEVVLERQIVAPRLTLNGAAAASTPPRTGAPAALNGNASQRPALPPSGLAGSRAESDSAARQKTNPLGNWNPWRSEPPPAPPPASIPAAAFPAAGRGGAATTQLASGASPGTPTQLPVAAQASAVQPPATAASAVLYGTDPNSPAPVAAQSKQLADSGENPAGGTMPTVWPSRSLALEGQSVSQSSALPFNRGATPRMSIGLGSTVDLPQEPANPGPAAASGSTFPINPASDQNGSGNQSNIRPAAGAGSIPGPLLPSPGAAANPPTDAATAGSGSMNIQPTFASTGRHGEAGSASVLGAHSAALPIGPPPENPVGFTPQAVDSLRFRLNYENTYLDRSVVKNVILWLTSDGGQTWRSYGEDADAESPFPVQVDSEGVYGFRLVYETTDGVRGRSPGRGDQPDIWVRVDTTPPEVQLISAPFGRGAEAGALVINWRAEDLDLGEHPISLSWSPTAEGPWTRIVGGHPNTGSYAWRMGNQAPDRVFLQVEARDSAGNLASSQTTRPVELHGLAPRGRILSVDPVK